MADEEVARWSSHEATVVTERADTGSPSCTKSSHVLSDLSPDRVAGLRPLPPALRAYATSPPRAGVPPPPSPSWPVPPSLPPAAAGQVRGRCGLRVSRFAPSRANGLRRGCTALLDLAAPLGLSASRWKHPRLASRFASDRFRTRLWEFACTDFGNPSTSGRIPIVATAAPAMGIAR